MTDICRTMLNWYKSVDLYMVSLSSFLLYLNFVHVLGHSVILFLKCWNSAFHFIVNFPWSYSKFENYATDHKDKDESDESLPLPPPSFPLSLSLATLSHWFHENILISKSKQGFRGLIKCPLIFKIIIIFFLSLFFLLLLRKARRKIELEFRSTSAPVRPQFIRNDKMYSLFFAHRKFITNRLSLLLT